MTSDRQMSGCFDVYALILTGVSSPMSFISLDRFENRQRRDVRVLDFERQRVKP